MTVKCVVQLHDWYLGREWEGGKLYGLVTGMFNTDHYFLLYVLHVYKREGLSCANDIFPLIFKYLWPSVNIVASQSGLYFVTLPEDRTDCCAIVICFCSKYQSPLFYPLFSALRRTIIHAGKKSAEMKEPSIVNRRPAWMMQLCDVLVVWVGYWHSVLTRLMIIQPYLATAAVWMMCFCTLIQNHSLHHVDLWDERSLY